MDPTTLRRRPGRPKKTRDTGNEGDQGVRAKTPQELPQLPQLPPQVDQAGTAPQPNPLADLCDNWSALLLGNSETPINQRLDAGIRACLRLVTAHPTVGGTKAGAVGLAVALVAEGYRRFRRPKKTGRILEVVP